MIVEWRQGTAAEFEARQLPEPLEAVTAWVYRVERPMLVLGSAQREHVAATDAARAGGVEVVRRNSGGGAVLLTPGECLWVDVLLPRSDPRWVADVGLSSHWLGDAWAKALASLGVSGTVHRGALERNDWGRLVCFAAIGPGEVTVNGRKVVGISQRRTKAGARFQCLVLTRWDPGAIVDLLDIEPERRTRARAELGDSAAGVGVPLSAVEDAFLTALRESSPDW